MHRHATAPRPQVEPAFVDADGGATFLAVSLRTFHYLVSSGEIQPVHIPNIRRTVYDVAELSWASGTLEVTTRGTQAPGASESLEC